MAALYIAIEHHLQIGRQLVLTRGPLGFIDWPMYLNRELLLISVLVQVASALALGYLLVLLLTRCGLRFLVPRLLLGCFCCLKRMLSRSERHGQFRLSGRQVTV